MKTEIETDPICHMNILELRALTKFLEEPYRDCKLVRPTDYACFSLAGSFICGGGIKLIWKFQQNSINYALNPCTTFAIIYIAV